MPSNSCYYYPYHQLTTFIHIPNLPNHEWFQIITNLFTNNHSLCKAVATAFQMVYCVIYAHNCGALSHPTELVNNNNNRSKYDVCIPF